MNGEPLTVLRLITALDQVHDAIEGWYRRHSRLDSAMNLRPLYRSREGVPADGTAADPSGRR